MGVNPYHCAPMNGQHIPQGLDPFKQIGSGNEIGGQIALEKLSRLDGLLANQEGFVSAALQFYRDEQHIAVVSGQIASDLHLTCQRCLQADEVSISGEFTFALIRDEAHIDNLPDGYEALVLDKPELNLYALIEEELILSLPIVHFHDGQCKDGEQKMSFGELDKNTGEKANPFAVLDKLKS